jgi:hypothetical protein
MMQNTAEGKRISGSNRAQWQRWGTYLFNRSWGNVRESAPSEQEPWVAFPFEHANSRVYRWTEDGIGGLSDDQQNVCLGVAFWNERDPILKERYFGLGNEPGNHGEGIKDYFFLLDGLPSYSYMKMLYKYPQVEFPYDRLYKENLRRGQDESSFELIDALVNTFHENRYFDIFIEYAKADAEDILCRITAVNRADEAAPLHILPQLWFRNTWQQGGARPELYADGKTTVRLQHAEIGERWWRVEAPDVLLFTENESNTMLLFDTPNPTPYVKDGIDYALVRGRSERVNPEKRGTKCAADCYQMVEPGATWIVRVRFQPQRSKAPFADFDAIFEQRQREADEFYAALQRPDLSDEERDIQRKAFAALNWNRKFYHFNVDQWLNEDAKAAAPKEKQAKGLDQWRHFDAHDILSIPDPWEYPWFAQWDLDFQLVTQGLIDPEFARRQVLLLLDERYMHPDGAIPAFEGDFSTPHPAIHAWAAWHVYQQSPNRRFLHNAYVRLKRNYAWWLKTQNQGEPYLFGGGFLGMDNISIFNRSEDVPEGGWLAQADGTGWMALFTLNLLAMAIELGEDADAAAFLNHFMQIRKALLSLWSDEDQFFYDLLYTPETGRMLLKVRSLVGLVPLTAALLIDPETIQGLPQLRASVEELQRDGITFEPGVNGCYLLAALSPEKIGALLKAVFDPDEFYSRYGIRSLSKYHDQHPVSYKIGDETFDLKYEPGESSKKLFGGNSNWRGPVWAPLNQLIVEALYIYHEYFGDPFREPANKPLSLDKAAGDLARRLISIFQRDADGRRPLHGDNEYFQFDPYWREYFWFYEHFQGDTGAGLGASHQNGWTVLVAKLIQTGGQAVFVPRPPATKANSTTLKQRV